MVGLFCMKYPYTYLIGWSKHDLWYYGVRFANTRLPEDDLWKKYFTSSFSVKTARKTLGEPDVIEVRKLHKDPQTALLWESRVLKKMKVLQDDRWLNANIGGKEFANIEGRKISEEARRKIGLARKRWWAAQTPEFRAEYAARSGSRTPQGAAKIAEKAKERFQDPEFSLKWREQRQTSEFRSKMSAQMNSAWSDPLKKQNLLDAMSTPEYKANLREAMKRVNADPEVNRKRSESCKLASQSPEAREKRRQAGLKSAEARHLKKLQNNA